MHWYLEVLKKRDFRSRARRKEYWMFSLVNFIIGLVLALLVSLTADTSGNSLISVLERVYGLMLLVPSLAVTARRLHDTNRSGWWMLIALVPFIGWVIFLVWMVKDSDPGENRFGPNPKQVTAIAAPAPSA